MMNHSNILTTYSLDDISKFIESKTFFLSTEQRARIEASRRFLENFLFEKDQMIYGVNSGFGSLCNVRIEEKDMPELQHNLIRSHACGTGEMVKTEIVRIMLLLKILNLSFGYSGVRMELVDFLILLFEKDIIPVIYSQGSLGASGDLAPLSHLALVCIGEGEVHYKGKKIPTDEAFQELSIKPMTLEAKEGLALLNGTQFSTALAVHGCLKARKLMMWAHRSAVLSIEAFNCNTTPFDKKVSAVRNQSGQIESAATIRSLLKGSNIDDRQKHSLQDPYAFRCTPQVVGASMDVLKFVEQTVTREINGVTDNPNIFCQEGEIISGGNFHAQPIAYVNDFLAIAMSEVGSISERRIYQLIHGLRDLPPFLTKYAGIHSGLMIPQYTAASIVSQNKQLCSPASVDSITSSAGQEDHVSMAANAGTKLVRVLENVHTIISIEWMTAAQAIEFRPDYILGTELSNLFADYRKNYVLALDEDRILFTDIEKTKQFLNTFL